MRRFTAHTIRLAAAVATGLGLTLAGGPTAGAAPGPPPTEPVPCTISGSGWVFGTSGNDVICGSGGVDHLYGLGGNDVIYAGAGADTIYGGPGNDVIYAGPGGDGLFGDSGLGDRLYADDGAPWDKLHDPDGAYYRADVLWPPQPSIPQDTADFPGPPGNYHWMQ